MNTTDPRPSETIADTWGDTLKIIKRHTGDLTLEATEARRRAVLAGIKPAELRAALDRLSPPEPPETPVVDLDTAGRFAVALKAAGYEYDHRNVPVGVLRDAIREAIAPRPGWDALAEAVADAGYPGDRARVDALYAAGVRLVEADAA